MAVQRVRGVAGLASVVFAVAVACGSATPAQLPPSAPVTPPSASTQAVRVPELIGKSRVRAIRAVLQLALNVRVVPLGRPKGRPRDRVARQVPLPGSRVPLGAEVVLAVYCSPRPCPSPPPGRTIYDPCTCATRT